MDISRQGCSKCVLRHRQGLGTVASAGVGLRHVGECGYQSAIFIGGQLTWVCVDHGSELPSVDVQLAQQGSQYDLRQLAPLHRSELGASVESAVTAFTTSRIETEGLSSLVSLVPSSPNELTARHRLTIAP